MYRFLLPPLVLMLLGGGLLAFMSWRLTPFTGEPPAIEIYHNRLVVFLVSAFAFLTSFSSLVLYLIYRLLGDYRQPRFTFRRSLRQGFLLGLGVVVVAILLLTQTANFMTLTLVAAVMVSLEFTLREE